MSGQIQTESQVEGAVRAHPAGRADQDLLAPGVDLEPGPLEQATGESAQEVGGGPAADRVGVGALGDPGVGAQDPQPGGRREGVGLDSLHGEGEVAEVPVALE